ncbi:hypothetical protein BJ875DRAFT_430011, partial [Amylocarpus encephaloides]
MDSLFSLPLPFQRRLTKMYTDTKSSYDFVKEPVQAAEDPELVSLHRKLRIQKDRLVSWGLEWSDPSQSPDIDESINKAGLSELVGSVMSTIKEILAEAEPLWQSSKSRTMDEKGPGMEKALDRKQSLITWDKSRFQDLVRDLTMSIDTLYDLSRTRQSARKAHPGKTSDSSLTKSHAVEERLFESNRIQTPKQIDPAALIWPRDLKGIQLGMLQPAKSPRQIVFMRRPSSLPDSRKHGQQLPLVPVLLEHALYDPIYSITGIQPSLTRFEKLFAALSQSYISTGRTLSGLLHLIGYFEEPESSRFCLLFALPTHFGPVDIASPRLPSISFLSDILLARYEPSLEIKYRLAHNVATAVFDLHSKGIVHGNICPSNILFIEHQSQAKSRMDVGQINMRQSFLSSYDLFSDNVTDGDSSNTSAMFLHRHSLDPRTTRYTNLTSESKSLDLYSLAMLLLEIGLWTPLPDIFSAMNTVPDNPTGVFKQLATRCGSLYMKTVQACWRAPEDELSQKARADVMHQKTFWKVSKALQTCCALDETAEEENTESDDHSTPIKSGSSTPIRRGLRESKSQAFAAGPTTPSRPTWSEKPSFTKQTSAPTFPEVINWNEKPTTKPAAPVQVPAPPQSLEKPKPKLRTYPAVKINQEHLNFWHTGLMPHINHVLRGFYRKYPESVEISLESIGESPTTTKPTILVICTSVQKVRSILKKHLVYDKQTYGLKVCRGKVLRSRSKGARRSMARELSGDKPVNAEHQDRPGNGASIGAYVNDKHLPPVSLGGLIMINGEPYGMTVHHMLDDPEEDDEDEIPAEPVLRSSAYYSDMPELTHSDSSDYSSGDEFMFQLSDSESEFGSEADSESEFDDDDDYMDESDRDEEPGDIEGIPEGCGEGYIITQPAIDDVDAEFYPDQETRDEDHLDSYTLGQVHASSGIRRRTEDGTIHEIDWALFEINEERRPEGNNIENGERFCRHKQGKYPLSVAPSKDLANLPVHCMARTSGLRNGRILPGMAIVKIYGRETPSSSYQVAGGIGVPGDSGAWVIDNEQGRACGHVLAWSPRKRVAYICPMDILLRDIKQTLHAERISMPGGEDLFVSEKPETRPKAVQRTASEESSHPEIASSHEEEYLNRPSDFKLQPTPEQIDASLIRDDHRTQHPERSPSTTSTNKEKEKEKSGELPFTIPIRLVSGSGGDAKTALRHDVNFIGSSRASGRTIEDVGVGTGVGVGVG